MSTDGRYLYHHGQGVPPTHYEYTPYSQSSAHQPAYDNTPVPQQQPPARPIRSNSSSSSQSHSPHQQAQYNPPPSPYPPSYAPSPTYMAQPPAAPPPAPQPVWTGEGWSHHYGPSTFHPQHQSGPPPGSPYNSGPGRPDVTSSSSVETSRGYSSIAPPPPNSEVPSRRIDERQAAAPPPNFPLTYQPKIKRRESESSPPVSAVSPSATSTGLDFMKVRTYLSTSFLHLAITTIDFYSPFPPSWESLYGLAFRILPVNNHYLPWRINATAGFATILCRYDGPHVTGCDLWRAYVRSCSCITATVSTGIGTTEAIPEGDHTGGTRCKGVGRCPKPTVICASCQTTGKRILLFVWASGKSCDDE